MRAAQGLRWMANGTARNVVSAIASLRCQDSGWSERDVPSRLKGHGEEGEEEEEEEEEAGNVVERRAVAARASRQRGQANSAAASSFDFSSFLCRQFVDVASLSPGAVVRVLVAGHGQGEEVCVLTSLCHSSVSSVRACKSGWGGESAGSRVLDA
jgi:hypothetical protein